MFLDYGLLQVTETIEHETTNKERLLYIIRSLLLDELGVFYTCDKTHQ